MRIKRKIFTVFIAGVILFLCGLSLYNNTGSRLVFRQELKRFSEETYDSVLLSMHSSSGYTPEVFMTYLALDTAVSSYEIKNMNELKRYLENIFSSGNEVGNVFLMLDPNMIWNACNKDALRWEKALQEGLFSFVSAHPETGFKILLPYPSLRYWVGVEQAVIDDTLSANRRFVEDVCAYPNAPFIYYMGSEKWLIINPDNYISDFDVNDVLADKIFLACFANDISRITPDNAETFFDTFRRQVDAERTSPTVYPDLSDRCLVFFGDSIMDYGKGSLTTPGFITGFSDAVTYNYAVGGTFGSAHDPNKQDFPVILPRFLSEYCVVENGIYRFSPDGADLSDKKLYFLFTYGANDYFSGIAVDNPNDPYDSSTYAGSLRRCLKTLMAAFPDAEYIVMTPNYTKFFSNGTDRNSDVGGVLTDYVDAVISVTKELGIHYIDNYHGLPIDASNVDYYTTDGCHPNEYARILMAERIIDFIDGL